MQNFFSVTSRKMTWKWTGHWTRYESIQNSCGASWIRRSMEHNLLQFWGYIGLDVTSKVRNVYGKHNLTQILLKLVFSFVKLWTILKCLSKFPLYFIAKRNSKHILFRHAWTFHISFTMLRRITSQWWDTTSFTLNMTYHLLKTRWNKIK